MMKILLIFFLLILPMYGNSQSIYDTYLDFNDGNYAKLTFMAEVISTDSMIIKEKEFIGTFWGVSMDICSYCLNHEKYSEVEDTYLGDNSFMQLLQKTNKKLYRQLRKQGKNIYDHREYIFRQGDNFLSVPIAKKMFKDYRAAIGYDYLCKVCEITLLGKEETHSTVIIKSMIKIE